MNTDTIHGKWEQLKGKLRQYWGELTDDDLQKIEGKKDVLKGILREKYGYTNEEIDKKLNELKEFDEDNS